MVRQLGLLFFGTIQRARPSSAPLRRFAASPPQQEMESKLLEQLLETKRSSREEARGGWAGLVFVLALVFQAPPRNTMLMYFVKGKTVCCLIDSCLFKSVWMKRSKKQPKQVKVGTCLVYRHCFFALKTDKYPLSSKKLGPQVSPFVLLPMHIMQLFFSCCIVISCIKF